MMAGGQDTGNHPNRQVGRWGRKALGFGLATLVEEIGGGSYGAMELGSHIEKKIAGRPSPLSSQFPPPRAEERIG